MMIDEADIIREQLGLATQD